MPNDSYILGDWGSSHSRFYLCQSTTSANSPTIIDCLKGKGVKSIDNTKAYFFDLTANWYKNYQPRQVVLAGMVGSTIGWTTTPYLAPPISFRELALAAKRPSQVHPNIFILPGLKCKNLLHQWDVMRGEEIQVLGAFEQTPTLKALDYICVPGTHCKWVHIENGEISQFTTSISGELYELLAKSSTLLSIYHDIKPSDSFPISIFVDAVKKIRDADNTLLHWLFSVRADQVLELLNPLQAQTFLSGLMLASEVKDSLDLVKKHDRPLKKIAVIASQALLLRYKLVFELFNIEPILIDSDTASIRGLQLAYHYLR